MNVFDNFYQNHPGANTLSTPGALISTLLPNVLIVAGLVLLVLIIISGFNLMSASGSGNQQVITKYKQAITYGLLGFLIVVSAYFILQIVGFGTGVDYTNLGNVNLNP